MLDIALSSILHGPHVVIQKSKTVARLFFLKSFDELTTCPSAFFKSISYGNVGLIFSEGRLVSVITRVGEGCWENTTMEYDQSMHEKKKMMDFGMEINLHNDGTKVLNNVVNYECLEIVGVFYSVDYVSEK